jgi:type II secretion system protein N
VSPRAKKILRWVGYPLFYLFCLALFAYLTFPYERLKNRIVAEVNARQTGASSLHLDIDNMSSYWFSGVEADGVKFTGPPPAATSDTGSDDGEVGADKGEKKPAKPEQITIDEAHARVSLLRLLVGTVYVSFGADAFGGSISGNTSDADKSRSVHVELESVDVGKLPMLKDIVGLPMTGSLDGKVDLKLPGGKAAKASGNIDLTITNLTVGNGKAKIRNTIALPKLNAGTVTLKAEVTEGRLAIEKFSSKGRDLDFVCEGKIRLRDPADESLAELSLRFKFSDSYKNKNDMTRGLFGAPGSKMPGLFDLDPKNKRAKRPDGFYAWRATGPFSHILFEPAFGGLAAPRRGAGLRAFPR